jgi:protein dithiol oxidoreductase (disulfide-forming)
MNVTKKLIALFLLGVSFSAFASFTNPENGKEYQTLERPQPTDAQGKVEVLEFFFYTCPHCNMLDPYITAWAKKQGNAIVFKRIPVDFGQGQQALQRMYYTLEAMGKLDEFHGRIFKAIHTDRIPMFTEQQVQNFLTKNGIDEKKYLDMSKSFGVATKITRAKALQAAYKIEAVPTIYVDGRYMTSPAQVISTNPKMTEQQSEMALMQVLDALVLRAAKEHKSVPANQGEQKPKK